VDLSKRKLVLASRSPRRRELLEEIGLSFSVEPSSFDERSVELGSPWELVSTLAIEKASEVSSRFPEAVVLGADTIVVVSDDDPLEGGEVINKPEDADDARAMLKRLSGTSHFVLTGYCLLCRETEYAEAEVVTSEVKLTELLDEEIAAYVASGEPLDKAGAYAVQGRAAGFVEWVAGSYSNVVGLPLCEVRESLKRIGLYTPELLSMRTR